MLFQRGSNFALPMHIEIANAGCDGPLRHGVTEADFSPRRQPPEPASRQMLRWIALYESGRFRTWKRWPWPIQP